MGGGEVEMASEREHVEMEWGKGKEVGMGRWQRLVG